MTELFMQGGPFMWPLTLLAAAAVLLMLKKAADVFVKDDEHPEHNRSAISAILQLGILSLVLGILGQGVGLFQALRAIEAAADISPAIIFGGLKVSMITPIYGMLIFVAAFTAWAVLKHFNEALDA